MKHSPPNGCQTTTTTYYSVTGYIIVGNAGGVKEFRLRLAPRARLQLSQTVPRIDSADEMVVMALTSAQGCWTETHADAELGADGFGSSVAAEIASDWWRELGGPIGCVHPKFTRVSYRPMGEKAVMPGPESVVAEALRILKA